MTKNNQQQDPALRMVMRRRAEAAGRMTLPEDFTDRLMQRIGESESAQKAKRRLWWIAAAACLLLIIGIGVTMWPREETTVMAKMESAQKSQTAQMPQEKIQEKTQTPPRPTATPSLEGKGGAARSYAPQKGKGVAAPSKAFAQRQKPLPDSSAADRLNYYIAHLEAEMEALDDSVRAAHVEKLIAADVRLQQLVNRIVKGDLEQVMNEMKKDSTANYINF